MVMEEDSRLAKHVYRINPEAADRLFSVIDRPGVPLPKPIAGVNAKTGKNIMDRAAIIVMTTNNSIRVKPERVSLSRH